jgi:hypothetical protein
MKVERRYPLRKFIIFTLAMPAGLAMGALLGPSYVAAQGTPEQRAACEDEARWLCSNYIPDVDAIKGCMQRNLNHLSPRCRAMFGHTPRRKTGRGKHSR